MATAPQTTPYSRDGIREGWPLLRIPSSGANRLDLPFDQTIGHQGDQREQPEKSRRGPSNREVAPLSLSFYPEMRSGFFKGHLHAPTPHKPGQDLQWWMAGVRRKKRLWFIFVLRVADQHPTDRNWLMSAFVPDTGLAVDFDLPLISAVPILDLNFCPRRLRIIQTLLWRRPASAFDSRPPILSRFSFRSRIPQLGVHSQSCNQAGLGRAADTAEQIQHCKTAIINKDQLSIGQPASDQLNDLPGPLDQALMPSSAFSVIAFRRTQNRQEGQSPDRFGPRDFDQQHTAEPAQATGFNKMRMGRSHRVTVDPFGFDFGATPPLDRVVNPKDEFPFRRERGDQQAQQDLASRQSRPSRSIQDSMIALKMDLLAHAHHAQARRNRAFASGKKSPDQQHFDVFPNGLGEQRRELYNQWQQLGRQYRHPEDLSWRKVLPKLMRPAVTFSKIKIG